MHFWVLCALPVRSKAQKQKITIKRKKFCRILIKLFARNYTPRKLIFIACILSFLYFFLGKPTIEPIISSLEENSPAQNSGLMVGDKIVKISDQKVYSFADIPRIINSKQV